MSETPMEPISRSPETPSPTVSATPTATATIAATTAVTPSAAPTAATPQPPAPTVTPPTVAPTVAPTVTPTVAPTVAPTVTPIVTPTSGVDVDDGTQDTNVQKLDLKVKSFINIAGLVSNVGVLVLLLGQQSQNEFFAPLVTFISLSVILQLALASVLIVRHSYVEEALVKGTTSEEVRKYNTLSRNLLTVSSVMLMLITVFNVFIVAFAGIAGVSSVASTPLGTSSPT